MELGDTDLRLREIKLSYLRAAARSRIQHLPELMTSEPQWNYVCECCGVDENSLSIPALYLGKGHGQRKVPEITTTTSEKSSFPAAEEEMASNSSFLYPMTDDFEQEADRLYATPSLLFPDNLPNDKDGETLNDAMRNFIINDTINVLLDRVITVANPTTSMKIAPQKSHPRKTRLRLIQRSEKHRVHDTVLRPTKTLEHGIKDNRRVMLGVPAIETNGYHTNSIQRDILGLKPLGDIQYFSSLQPKKLSRRVVKPDVDEIRAIDVWREEKLYYENMQKLRNSFTSENNVA